MITSLKSYKKTFAFLLIALVIIAFSNISLGSVYIPFSKIISGLTGIAILLIRKQQEKSIVK